MKPRSRTGRMTADFFVKLFSVSAAVIGVAALVWILFEVVLRGLGAFDLSFFTKLPTPPGIPGGGIANAIAGTAIMTGLAALIGIPVGLLAGVFLAEFGRESLTADTIRFLSNVLMGMPSIIIGVFVYTLIVVSTRSFSGYAGVTALVIIMLPLMTRTTEDILNLVPDTLRESALALGAPRWKATLGIVFRAARTGLVTGALLAIARVSGETAPLLFTALNSPYWTKSLNQPTANLTVTIFNYAMSPYADWQKMAWGASLLITAGILLITVCTRLIMRERAG